MLVTKPDTKRLLPIAWIQNISKSNVTVKVLRACRRIYINCLQLKFELFSQEQTVLKITCRTFNINNS